MRQKTFWMKLHTEERKLAVGDPHDLTIAARFLSPRRDFEFFGQRVRLNHEAMVARRLKWIVEPGKQPTAIVVDHVGLAVHQILGANDRRAERLSHRLMAKAHAQQRQPALQSLATLDRDSGLRWRTRTGRNDHAIGRSFEDLVDRNLIVAKNLNV